jgi:hypothetical protein
MHMEERWGLRQGIGQDSVFMYFRLEWVQHFGHFSVILGWAFNKPYKLQKPASKYLVLRGDGAEAHGLDGPLRVGALQRGDGGPLIY